MSTAPRMIVPPIVGVPAFVLWLAGPSSRISSPNLRLRSHAIISLPNTSTSTSAVSAA